MMTMLHHSSHEMANLADKLLKFCKDEGYDLGPIPAALGVNLGGGQSGLAFNVELDGGTHTVVVVPFDFDGIPDQ